MTSGITLRPIDALRLHPDAAKVPMPDAADLSALRQSLAEHGQQDPIDITSDGVVLDGRTRWTLLRELGATSIQTRENAIPDDQQVTWIVERAVARRHLTNEQKQALNELLRSVVVEVITDRTGKEMRIGMSQRQRAEKLGVDRATITRWEENVPQMRDIPPDAPTHIRRTGGNPTPYPIRPSTRPKAADAKPRMKPASTRRVGPNWRRHFTLWCRRILPEDRRYLLEMSSELHQALDLLGINCETRETE